LNQLNPTEPGQGYVRLPLWRAPPETNKRAGQKPSPQNPWRLEEGHFNGMPEYGDRTRKQRNGYHVLTGIRVTQHLLDGLRTLHSDFLRGVRNGRKIAMRRCDLSRLDFTGMNLSKAELLACNFDGSQLSNTDFHLANLFAGSFEDADLTGANFEKADMRAATFERANLTDTKLVSADLRDCAIMDDKTNQIGNSSPSIFRNALLRATNMAHSKLKSAIFNGALLQDIDLRNADMRNTQFQGAEMVRVNLTGARLADADLRGTALTDTDLSGIDLTRAKTADTTGVTDDWIQERLAQHAKWIASGGNTGERAIFAGLELSGRSFAGANLAAADLGAATLVGANLSNAMLAAVNLKGANLLNANLRGADIRGADLTDTNMRSAILVECKTGVLPGTLLMTLLKQAV
jgi:uncharacterized protein YjbI with pentapeptide repeats